MVCSNAPVCVTRCVEQIGAPAISGTATSTEEQTEHESATPPARGGLPRSSGRFGRADALIYFLGFHRVLEIPTDWPWDGHADLAAQGALALLACAALLLR